MKPEQWSNDTSAVPRRASSKQSWGIVERAATRAALSICFGSRNAAAIMLGVTSSVMPELIEDLQRFGHGPDLSLPSYNLDELKSLHKRGVVFEELESRQVRHVVTGARVPPKHEVRAKQVRRSRTEKTSASEILRIQKLREEARKRVIIDGKELPILQLEQIIASAIRSALRNSNGRMIGAAAQLGISSIALESVLSVHPDWRDTSTGAYPLPTLKLHVLFDAILTALEHTVPSTEDRNKILDASQSVLSWFKLITSGWRQLPPSQRLK